MRKSILKTISWRIIASVVTVCLVFLFNKNALLATSIGVAEFVLKIPLYFAHERIWTKIMHKRKSMIKSISWRIIASSMTASLVIISGASFEVAGIIGAMELAIKLIVYYGHEILWSYYKISEKKTDPAPIED